jgi:Protein of unknown function (DUF2380)
MDRRSLLTAGVAATFGALPGHASSQPAAAPLRSLAVLDFELVDDNNNPATKADQERRLAAATRQLEDELAQRRLYRIVDLAPALGLLTKLRNQQEYMYRCDDCAVQVGQLLGVELVMGTWVQKVSELILNLNVQIVDVRRGQPIFAKSVDMRGNDDVSWTRAVRFLVRDMTEKRERNPRYAQ